VRLAEHRTYLGKGRVNKKFKLHEHQYYFLWISCCMLLYDYRGKYCQEVIKGDPIFFISNNGLKCTKLIVK